MQGFTPIGPASESIAGVCVYVCVYVCMCACVCGCVCDLVCVFLPLTGSKLEVSVVSHSKDEPDGVRNVDDDQLYVVHDEGEGPKGEGPGAGEMGTNINRFRNRVTRESESSSSDEEVSDD